MTIRQLGRQLRVLALLLTLPGIPACGAGEGSALPVRPSSASPAASAAQPSPSQPYNIVLKTYAEYWAALAKAGRSTPDGARTLLTPYVRGAYLNHLLDGVRQMNEQGQEPYGEVIPRVKEVRVGGKRAEVIDCQDTSKAGMADRRTHQLIPGTLKANSTANIKAELEQSSDGRWRLVGLSIREAACTPPSS